MTSPPVALTIAGSDNSAGAGAQADLKTFSALGVYGLTAITCVVAEVPGRVRAIQPVDPKIVAQQIALSFGAFPIAAVKTGMLHSHAVIEAVCEGLEKTETPLVVDPVMIASSGDRLLDAEALQIYKTRLFKRALLITPNLDEAGALLGRNITAVDEMRAAARELSERFGASWLLKGGHLAGDEAMDVLCENGEFFELSAPFMRGVNTHGTGCTYSAAIAAHLARGLALRDAIAAAKHFVTRAIRQHFRWGQTHALNHFANEPSPL